MTATVIPVRMGNAKPYPDSTSVIVAKLLAAPSNTKGWVKELEIVGGVPVWTLRRAA